MDTLIDKITNYWDHSRTLDKEAHSLSKEMEQSLIDRYISLLEKHGESAQDAHDRGGGICIPFAIQLTDFNDDDASIFITGIDILKSVKVNPSREKWVLRLDASAVNQEKGKIYPYENHLHFWELPFNRQCKIYKDFVAMGFFDGSRIELFPNV